MIRVVIDTSVLIRYLIRPSAATRELIEVFWLDDVVEMVTAPALIEELEGVLSRDYMQVLIGPADGRVLLETIQAKAEILSSVEEAPAYTRDPKDDKFVACALVGDAAFVVTVDEDILVLGQVGEVRMVRPEEVVRIVRRSGG